MDLRGHLHLTGEALKRWLIAQTLDAVCVGIFWLVGLWIIDVPWAPLWALLGALFQYIPNFGPVLSLIGPAIAAALSGGGVRFLYVLMLYGILAVLDGLVIQPYLLRRTARVPIWASILAPIVLGMIFSFWGVLVAAPLLAVIYAYRTRNRPPDAPV
jgi:predicted PurR-regulated permease PerM